MVAAVVVGVVCLLPVHAAAGSVIRVDSAESESPCPWAPSSSSRPHRAELREGILHALYSAGNESRIRLPRPALGQPFAVTTVECWISNPFE
ncbi:MAG: hypothetical protein CBB79_01890 [Synechococcus sp. TMED19]|nr:MAG: hypothetical protein CBB79_01890 [Synechococcus sp. TMED19]